MTTRRSRQGPFQMIESMEGGRGSSHFARPPLPYHMPDQPPSPMMSRGREDTMFTMCLCRGGKHFKLASLYAVWFSFSLPFDDDPSSPNHYVTLRGNERGATKQ